MKIGKLERPFIRKAFLMVVPLLFWAVVIKEVA